MDPQLQAFIQNQQQQIQQVKGQIFGIQQLIAGLQADALVRLADRKPRMEIEFTSQYGEDRLAWKILDKPTTGFFIEAGAFDGYHYSVTYALEAMGWNGLLVEAIPERYRDCVNRRPNSKVVNACLSAHGSTGDAQFMVMPDQMLSYSMTPDRTKQHGEMQPVSVSMPRLTLDQLLEGHTGPIDLVLLDLEGDEVSALNGFDLQRFRPRIVIVEDNTQGKNQALIEKMQSNQYVLSCRLEVNEIYIRADDSQLQQTMQWILMRGF